jgi:S1-C subfamily serine protease
MKYFSLLPFLLVISCEKPSPAPVATAPTPAPVAPIDPDQIKSSVVRVNSTQQVWNPGQPWEKGPAKSRRALAALVEGNLILTSAEMVTDATFLELESTDGTRHATAKVINVDYEANLTLLGLEDPEKDKTFFDGMKPLEISIAPDIGAKLDIVQVEENGRALLTSGTLQSAEVLSTFLPGQLFLTYQVKAAMQSSASSYCLPALSNGKLAGILSSYDSKDQICDVISTTLVSRFLTDSKNESYKGFPNLGVGVASTEDKAFREWLKIPETEGGLYITKVRKNSAADLAKMIKGDVMLAIDGMPIDRRGYYKDSQYGSLYWIQMVRGTKSSGDPLIIKILRDGKMIDVNVTLSRQEESTRLVPFYQFGKAPNFLVKGGMIFQELSRPLLEAYGEEWETRAPLNFLDVLGNPEAYQDKFDRVVCLTGVIPTPSTVGYESLRNLIISKVNGKPIRGMNELIDAFKKPPLGVASHSIEFLDEELVIYLDELTSDAVDKALLQRGLPILSRAE